MASTARYVTAAYLRRLVTHFQTVTKLFKFDVPSMVCQYKLRHLFLKAKRTFVSESSLTMVLVCVLQVLANGLDNKLREDLERLKKIRAHRGLRHFWG